MSEGNFPPDKDYEPDPPTPLFADMPEAEPFPIDCLPSALRDGVEGILAAVQCPDILAAASVMSSAGFIAQAHVNVRLVYGEPAPVSLFMMTVADTGERKTTADRMATKPIREFQQEKMREYAVERRAYKNSVEVHRAKRKEILETHSGDDLQGKLDEHGAEPEAPLVPIYLADDPTYEGGVKLAGAGPGYLGIFSSEGAKFVGGYGMTPEQKRKTAGALSSVWDGTEITRVRGGDDLTALHNRRWSMHLMLQPSVARDVFGDEDLVDQGFLSRVLPAWPKSKMGYRPHSDAPEAARDALGRYHRRLRALLDIPVPVVEDTRNELDPRVLDLDVDARALLIAFHDWVEEKLKPEGLLKPISGLAAKAAENAARLAGVFAFVENEACGWVPVVTMRNAIEIVRWYLNEALRIAGAVRVRPEVADAAAILEHLKRRRLPLTSVQDIQQHAPSRRLRGDIAAIRKAVSVLEEHGYLHPAGCQKVGEHTRRAAFRISWGSEE